MNNQPNLDPGKTEAERFLRQPKGTFPTNTTTKELRTLTEEAEQLTGFAHPTDITTTWNSTTKVVTLTAIAGKLNAFYKGLPIVGLTATDTTWTSPAIQVLNVADKYYLYSKDGLTVNWYANDMWTFGDLMVAMVYYNGSAWVCVVETHGLMDRYVHEQLHHSLGTVLRSGGDISGLTLNSTTAADRRPSISQAILADEDLLTTLPLLDKATATPYTQFILTGAATQTISTGNADIVPLSGNNPYYVTTLGIQTLFPANHYGKIFILAQPMANDVESQKNRFVFFQPQQTSSTLSTIQGVTKESLVTGSLGGLLNEYNFIGEIIIRYIGSNWQIISYSKLIGSKTSSASTPGGFLSSVTTDETLTGNGTPSSPLSVSGGGVEIVNDLTTGGTTKALSAEQGKVLQNTKYPKLQNGSGNFNNIFSTVVDLIGMGFSLQYANLTGVGVTGTNLSYANLSYANLTNTSWSGSNLSYANLSYANLTGVSVNFTNLSNANLTNANLTGADWFNANLSNANLTGATGLNSDINIALSSVKKDANNDGTLWTLTWTDGLSYTCNPATGLFTLTT